MVPRQKRIQQPRGRQEVEHEVVIKGVGTVIVDGDGKERRAGDGRYSPAQRFECHRHTVQLPAPAAVNRVVGCKREANIKLG